MKKLPDCSEDNDLVYLDEVTEDEAAHLLDSVDTTKIAAAFTFREAVSAAKEIEIVTDAVPKFEMGELLMTDGIEKAEFDTVALFTLITRHNSGDWGEMCEEDKQLNEDALEEDERLLSAYTIEDVPIYIITERDRSSTTVLRRDEY